MLALDTLSLETWMKVPETPHEVVWSLETFVLTFQNAMTRFRICCERSSRDTQSIWNVSYAWTPFLELLKRLQNCMFCRQTLDVAQVSPVLANLNQRPSVAYMPGVNHSTMAVRTTRTKYHHHNDALDTTPTRNNATLSTIVRIRIILAQIPIFSTKTKPYVCINGHQYFFVSTWRRRRWICVPAIVHSQRGFFIF
jgi:hypothetical protein